MTNRKSEQRRQRRLLRRVPRGQAMVEYSVVAHAILIGGSMLLLPMISELFKALTSFYDSVYTVLQSAAV